MPSSSPLESHIRHFRLMEHWPDRVYLKDTNREFVYCNAATRAMSNEDMIGKRDEDLFSPPHSSQARRDDETLLSGQLEQIEREELETWKDGRIQMVASNKIAVHDDSGNCVGIFGITRELSAPDGTRFLESLLNTNQASARKEFNQDDCGFWLLRLDDKRNKPFFSVAFRQLYPESRILGRFMRVAKAHRKYVVKFVRRALNGELGYFESMDYLYRFGSETIWMRVEAHVLEFEQAKTLIVAHKRLSEADLRGSVNLAIFEEFPGYVFVKDPKGQFLYANKRLLTDLNLQLADVVYKTDTELGFAPEEVDAYKKGDEQALKQGSDGFVSFDEPITIKGQKQSLITIKMKITGPTHESQVLGISLNATSLWQEIRESRRVGKAIMDWSPAAIYLKEAHGPYRYTDANQEYSEIMGVPIDAIKGTTTDKLFRTRNPELIDEIEKQDLLVLSGNPQTPASQIVQLPDGTYQWRLTSKFLLKDEYGKPWRILGISRDISYLPLTPMFRATAGIAPDKPDSFNRNLEQLSKLVFTGIRESLAIIMFCDIRKFSSAAAALRGNEEFIVELVSALFDILAVESQRMNFQFKFLGDGGMVVGLVHNPSNEQRTQIAQDMVTLALRVQQSYRIVLERWREKHRNQLIRLYSLKLGVGIHMATVQAGFLNNGVKFEFNVFGDPVVIAQRVESAAGQDGDEILVTHPVYLELVDAFEVGAGRRYKTKEEDVFAYPVFGKRV